MSSTSFNSVQETIGVAAATADADFMKKLKEFGDKKDVSTQELLAFQVEMQKWSLFTSTAGTVQQKYGDVVQDILKKMG
ncbi:EscF/YscF/HrpA family type III secretion system needle major subunit [Glaciimonas sp. GG7]